jgi:hypothetical protein
MTRVLPNPPPPGDDLDVLLGRFFKSEVPAPWPDFRPPKSARTLPLKGHAAQARHPRRMVLSRLALAASVGLLLLGGLLLGGKFTPSNNLAPPPLSGAGDANKKNRLPRVPADSPVRTPEKAKTGTTPER